MNTYNSKGTICIKGKYGLVYHICDIEYILNEDETFKYIFKPSYNIINLLSSEFFQGIPGLNLDLKKEEYIRDNRIPTFISERVPSENREDYYELLEKVNLEYMDPIQYLIRTKEQYSGDNFFVIQESDEQEVLFENFVGNETNSALMKEILVNICKGNRVKIGEQIIDDSNRKIVHDILLSIYSRSYSLQKELQRKGIEKAKKNGKYRGRKPQEIEEVKFLDLLDKVNEGKIRPKEACEKLGISIDKYYRLKKKLQK